MIAVILNLGDMKINNLMLVEKCKHEFKESEHYMDLTLEGEILLLDSNDLLMSIKKRQRKRLMQVSRPISALGK